ncbi:MAG: FG-GAP repeat protein [Acidobacteria bacterium]|nr:FG-GAP repeat protein [Acidobacteriota bacterium]
MTRWAMLLGLVSVLGTACDGGAGGGDADTAGDGEEAAEEGTGEADDDSGGDDAGEEADAAPACGNAVVEPDEECDDGNDTSGDGCENDCSFSCHDDADCDDGLDCTGDLCGEVEAGQACAHQLVTGECLLGGTCYRYDTIHPTEPCLVCDPGTSTDDWTPLPEGTSCEDGLFCNGAETCSAEGFCVTIEPGCGTGGCVDSCDESSDSCVPAHSTVVCRTALGGCDFEEKCDGTSLECPADEQAGAGFVCRPSLGFCDPEEVCTGSDLDCPPNALVAAGAACDDLQTCSTVDQCDGAGLCAGVEFVAPGTPRPYLPQNGSRTGATAAALRPMFRWMDSAWDGCATPTYDLQVDDSCTTPGFASCSFPTPELEANGITGAIYMPAADLPVGTGAPVGRRYYWRVRACRGATCSAWSAVWRFDLGRTPQDFDGDGFSDVVAGAPAQDGTATDEGAAYVFLGSAAGLASTPSRTLANPDHSTGGGFGFSTAAAGDLNADGFVDLAVGAPTDALPVFNGGRVFVYLGSAAGVPAAPSAILVNPAGQAGGQFGVAVAAAGDVNGDGFDDLVAGAHRQDGTATDQGAAWIFFGSAAGIATAPDITLPAAVPEAFCEFGRSVAGAGDLDADGFADVVVGAPYQDNGADDEGAAYVYLGAASGPATVPSVSLDDPTNQADARFGAWVATAGDININGYSELLVGAPAQANPTASEGNVYVYYGIATGVPTVPSGTFDNPGAQSGWFGTSAASVGDVNGDVNPDIAIGAPFQDSGATDEGNAFLYNGCYCGVIRTTPVTTTLDNPDDQANGHFGQAVSGGGDVNRDGFADLVVGASSQDEDPADREGMLFVYHGSTSGLPTTPTLRLADPGEDAGALFGWSLD